MTKLEKYERIRLIQEWIAAGFSDKGIRTNIEKKFGIKSRSQQDVWVKRALDDLYKDNPRREYIKEINDERLEKIINSTMKNDDHRNSLKAIDLSNKLNGLYTEKIEVTSDLNFNISFGEEEDK